MTIPSSNVLNVGKVVRSYSGDFRVSPGAVHELVSRLDLWFELNMKELCKVSRGHGRKTVMEDDVVEFFSVRNNEVLSG
jgi:histone H3/H4